MTIDCLGLTLNGLDRLGLAWLALAKVDLVCIVLCCVVLACLTSASVFCLLPFVVFRKEKISSVCFLHRSSLLSSGKMHCHVDRLG